MNYRSLVTGICCLVLMAQPAASAMSAMEAANDLKVTTSAKSAIQSADDAKTTAALMRAEAKDIADRARAKADVAEAKAEAARAAAALAKAESDQAAAEAAVAAAESAKAKAEEAAAKAEAKAAAAENAEAAAKAEYAAAKTAAEKAAIAAAKASEAEAAVAAAAEADAVAASTKAAAEAAAIAEANEAKTDEAAARAEAASDKAYAEAEARSVAAERQANQAAAALEAAEAKVTAAEAKLDSSSDARAEANDAKTVVADAKTNLADAKTALTEAKKDQAEAKKDLADANAAVDLAQQQAKPVQERRSFQWENRYYFFQDAFHNSGYQYVQPWDFAYQGDKYEVGLSTNYIISSYKSTLANSSGKVATWGDTTLSLGRDNPNQIYSLRYTLDVNMPTGKATLHGSQLNAVMNEHLVEFSRFGEGWNYTPGVSVSRRNGKEDIWTLGTQYSFRGKYTPDDNAGNITPGDEWMKFLRWQHIGQKWQLVGEVVHSSYGSTLEPSNVAGNLNYRQGSETDAKLTYNRELDNNHNLMLYYWHSTQLGYSSPNPALAGLEGTGTVQDQYFGAQWSVNWQDKYTFRVFADMMRESGASFNPVTDLFMGGGSKYSIGLGYDVDFTAKSRLSFDVARFYMRTNPVSTTAGSAPLNGYHGYNVYLRYFYNW